jgi:trk system potassium uptake protein TrkH
MFIAGTNFALHFRLLKGKPGFYWKSREFRVYVVLIGIFSLVLFANNLIHQQFNSVEESFRQSLFHVIAIITTTGYGAADWELWGGFAQVLLVSLMLVGGMAGSTGGGPKVVRIMIVFRQIIVELKRLIHPQAVLPLRIGHVLVDEGIVRNVLSFILAFMLILLISTAIISAFDIDIVTSFGASIACLSNIGPGLGDVGPTDDFGHFPSTVKWILVMLMMLGRLEVFTVMVLFSRHFWRK